MKMTSGPRVGNKRATGFLMAFLAVAILVGATACNFQTPERRAEFITDRISSALDLNKDQETKLNAVKDQILQIRKSQKEDRLQNIATVKQMILGEKLDAAQIKAMLAKRQKSMDDNFDPVFAKASEFHASLNAEQRKDAVKLIEKFQERFE